MSTPGSPSRGRRHRIRLVLVVLPVALALGLGLLHLRYPLPYVWRVLVLQDSDFEDIHRFPAHAIAASAAPSELPRALDPRVVEVFQQHPQVDDLGRLLEQTETSAFLVVHEGLLVEERYLAGHDRETLQNGFSVAKSVTSALVGLAIRDGVLERETPITRHLPELAERDERFGAITIGHLLDMRSGIRYTDDVDFPFFDADDPLIYYHPDLASVVLERTTIAEPPGSFRYNNYNPPLLGLILRRTTGLPAAAYLERELWGPIGAEGAAGWTVDDRGLERMESGFFARARDLARFGLLYLRRGVADGCRILPEDWVRDTTELPEPAQLDTYDGRSWGYRGGWWILPRPEGPSDFCAIGRYGQFVYVSPQYATVFVRSGPGRGGWGDRDWTELFYFAAARL